MKSMIVGGADVSGDIRREGQRNYISFLVGTEEKINRIYRDIDIDGIHMSELSDLQRKQVRDNLNFNSSDIQVWCFHVQRQRIEESFINHPKLKNPKLPKINIHKNFDHHLLRSIKEELQNFLFPRHQEFSDVTIQTDSDMRKTIEHWKMKRSSQGKAYELADAVAWFNQRQVNLNFCNHMDLRDFIKTSMEQDLLKR